jgi:putative redox protein
MKEAFVTWVEGLQFVGQAGDHAVVIDSRDAEGGGQNGGPSPMELVLLGVLGCTGMDVVSILKKKRQDVQGLKIHARAQQAETAPNYFTHVALEYVAFGDVEPDALGRAIELSEVKYCSAINTLNGKTKFSSSYRVEKVAASARLAAIQP